jgi:hypothetical protein
MRKRRQTPSGAVDNVISCKSTELFAPPEVEICQARRRKSRCGWRFWSVMVASFRTAQF